MTKTDKWEAKFYLISDWIHVPFTNASREGQVGTEAQQETHKNYSSTSPKSLNLNPWTKPWVTEIHTMVHALMIRFEKIEEFGPLDILGQLTPWLTGKKNMC